MLSLTNRAIKKVMLKYSKTALVPARAGSKRIKNKNIKQLGSKPLIAFSIEAAIKSQIFDHVICVTDSADYARVASAYGAWVPKLRPKTISGDTSPDIDWMLWILDVLKLEHVNPDILAVLRPTNPFRTETTINRAMNLFLADGKQDSLRAVQKVKEHPGKMWIKQQNRIQPMMPFMRDGTPWHSHQYANLPEVYIQNASLEIVWARVLRETGSIAGLSVLPFFTEGLEGFDINFPEDWLVAEHFLKTFDA